MFIPFADKLWIAEGPPVTGIGGFRFPTRMAALGLNDGRIVLWSPVKLTKELCDAAAALGPVQGIVAPNSFHRLFVKDWCEAFPNAQLYGARGLPDKRGDLIFDVEFRNSPISGWKDDIVPVPVPGNVLMNEVVLFHRTSGTAVFTDLLQNMPEGWYSGWRSIVARIDQMVGAEPHVPRKIRLAFNDRPAARGAIEKILGMPVERVVMAHGTPVTEGAGAFLRRAFAWLLK